MEQEIVRVEFMGFGAHLSINGVDRCICRCGCLSEYTILAGLCNDCCNGGHLIDSRYKPKSEQK